MEDVGQNILNLFINNKKKPKKTRPKAEKPKVEETKGTPKKGKKGKIF